MGLDPRRDQARYSREEIEGLIAGEFSVWDGAKTKRVFVASWEMIRSRTERTGRLDPHDDSPELEDFLEVVDVDRALAALNATNDDPAQRWRIEASMVLCLRMRGFTFEEIASFTRGSLNVVSLSGRAVEWLADYLNGKKR